MMGLDNVKIGDAVPETKSRVEKYLPIYYASASGDFNPIHIDPEFGKMVGLGGNILQGLCTMGFVARTCTEWAEKPGRLKRLKVRFAKRPTIVPMTERRFRYSEGGSRNKVTLSKVPFRSGTLTDVIIAP